MTLNTSPDLTKSVSLPSFFSLVVFTVSAIIGFMFNTVALQLLFYHLGNFSLAVSEVFVAAQMFSTTLLILLFLIILVVMSKVKYIPLVLLGLICGCIVSIGIGKLAELLSCVESVNIGW